MTVREALPDEARSLDPEQRAFLAALAGAVFHEGGPSGGDAWQSAIFSTAAGLGLPPGRAFAALYLAFLGRPNGPRAGWLLAGLDQAFVAARLREAAAVDGSMGSAGGGA
jgi:lysyl-tRNA synthetase class I